MVDNKSREDVISVIFNQLISRAPDRIKSINIGVMTYKYEVRIREKKYIIRFYPKDREHIVAFEPDIIRKCRTMNIKVPIVYSDSRNGPKSYLNYMIYEFVEGLPFHPNWPKFLENRF